MYPNTSGTFTVDENARLRQYEIDEHLWFADRPTLQQDRQRLIDFFKDNRCAWIHRGKVLVRVDGLHPEERME